MSYVRRILDSMTDTPARLLKLLSLLQTPREWPGGELAERLEVSPRTVRRDIDRLRELGYPVEATTGAEGGYRLVAGAAMPPLRAGRRGGGGDRGGAAGRGRACDRGRRRGVRTGAGEAGAGAAVAAAAPGLARCRPPRSPLTRGDGATIDPQTLTVMASAVAGPGAAAVRVPGGDGTETQAAGASRTGWSSTGRRWYLVAYDLDREDWRTFRVDRVERAVRDGRPVHAARELPTGSADGVRAAVDGRGGRQPELRSR